jgi:hypothetical protein
LLASNSAANEWWAMTGTTATVRASAESKRVSLFMSGSPWLALLAATAALSPKQVSLMPFLCFMIFSIDKVVNRLIAAIAATCSYHALPKDFLEERVEAGTARNALQRHFAEFQIVAACLSQSVG